MDDIFGLPGIFQTIFDQEQTGTLKVKKDEEEVYIAFRTGNICSIATPSAGLSRRFSILAHSLKRCSLLKPETIDKIIIQQRKLKKSLFLTIKEADVGEPRLQDDAFLSQICSNEIGEILYDMVSWPNIHCQFIEQDPTMEPAFDKDLLTLSIALNPGALVMEAARRQDEWQLIREHLPSNKDVPYMLRYNEETQKEFEELLKEEESNTEALRLMFENINGIRDFDEILEVVQMSKFKTMKILAKLAQHKKLGLKRAEDLKQMAHLDILQKDMHKCIRLYERATELGLRNIQTMKWLANAYDKEGFTNKAIEEYRSLGVVALDNNNYDEAIVAYTKVVEYAPEDLDSYEKLIHCYNRKGNLEKAAEISAVYARKVAVFDKKKAIMVLDGANRNYPSSSSNLELMATLYQEMGDNQNAILTYSILATLMRKQGNLDKTLEAYHKVLAVNPSHLDAHKEIAECYISVERFSEGVDQYKRLGEILIDRLEKESNNEALSGICDSLISVCETIIRYEPNSVVSREWMVDAYIVRKDKKTALDILREILGLLQKEENLPDLVANLRKIVLMEPEDFRSRKSLADTLLRLGERNAAIEEYKQLGLITHSKNDLRRAREAFESIIALAPFHLESRQRRADILKNLNLQAKAVDEYKLVGYLSKSVEDYDSAIKAFSNMVALAPDKELWGFIEIAGLCEKQGDIPKAVENYKEYAQKNIGRGNYGEAAEICERILTLSAGDADASAMLANAQGKFSTLQQYLGTSST